MTVRFPNHAQTARRMTALTLFVIGVSLTVVLYYVKTRAQSARAESVQLERLIQSEEAQIRVLLAEIAFLENPERLRELSMEQLGLEPIKVDRIIAQKDIEKHFPMVENSDE